MMDSFTRYPAAAAALPLALGERLWPIATLVRSRAGRSLLDLGASQRGLYRARGTRSGGNVLERRERGHLVRSRSRHLAAQVCELSEKVFELDALRVPVRLHCELLRLCYAAAAGDVVSGRVDHFPTYAELAARIGAHREAVTREIGFLSSRGRLTAHGNRTVTIDMPQLTELIRDAAGDLNTGHQSWPAPSDA